MDKSHVPRTLISPDAISVFFSFLDRTLQYILELMPVFYLCNFLDTSVVQVDGYGYSGMLFHPDAF